MEFADSLTLLELGRNALGYVGRELGALRNLRCLRLGGNRLSDLPPETAALRHLMELDIADNRFPVQGTIIITITRSLAALRSSPPSSLG